MRTLTRDRRPLVGFPTVWVTENVCRFLAGFGRVLADGVTARVVFMQDCFHADCLHARLFPGKIVFMQDCFHARLFPCRLSSCKIISMQDCFHAGFHATYVMRVVADGVTARIDGEIVAETDTESKR